MPGSSFSASTSMVEGMSEEAIQRRVSEYKQMVDRGERIATANRIGEAVRDLAEAIVRHYDGRVGTEEMTTLFRLCRISDRASRRKKQNRVVQLNLPDDVAEDIRSTIPDAGIVGGGKAQISIPVIRSRRSLRRSVYQGTR